MDNKQKMNRKITVSMLIILLLTFCLGITSYALFYVSVEIEENYFQTGVVEIDLNGGRPVIERHEYLFEPGMTVEKEFYVQNNSTWNVYYRVYMADVKGQLADVLEIRIWDKQSGTEYFTGTARNLTREYVGVADDELGIGEKKEMMISFHYPEESGNATQGQELSFSMCADAVQTKNNPNRLFE